MKLWKNYIIMMLYGMCIALKSTMGSHKIFTIILEQDKVLMHMLLKLYIDKTDRPWIWRRINLKWNHVCW